MPSYEIILTPEQLAAAESIKKRINDDKAYKAMAETNEKYEKKHGSFYDRGGSDSYYRRTRFPHKWIWNDEKESGYGIIIEATTPEEIEAYNSGYDLMELSGFRKWDTVETSDERELYGVWIPELQPSYIKSITSSHGVVCFNCSVDVCENKCYEEAEQMTKELKNLAENKLKRQATYEKYKEFIDNLNCKNKLNGAKNKGIRYKTHLQQWLRFNANHTYKTDDEEYHEINKFGRGIWNEEKIKISFTKSEQQIIIDIAKGYGAFDY